MTEIIFTKKIEIIAFFDFFFQVFRSFCCGNDRSSHIGDVDLMKKYYYI